MNEMVDALSVERRRPAFHAVHHISLRQQKFRQMGAVLAGRARDEGYFR
jgi:hypothetical protein